eukprot:786641-Prorocentrum_lima.AAC.1
MTSSLVGSEMCIRDSFSCDLYTQAQAATLDVAQQTHITWLAERALPPLSCLLYTSDAADDM